MLSVTDAQRRALLVRRHHLLGDARTPEEVVGSVLALHATDPASAYVQVLARGASLTVADVQAALYERHTLVRWMAMRRTLFVFPVGVVPTIQAAVSTPLAETLRRRLISQLTRNGTEPAIEGSVAAWLSDVEEGAHAALLSLGSATGAQLSAAEPRLRTAIVPRAKSDYAQNVTSTLLTLMSAEGRIVRGTAVGAWTTRAHRWEPPERWWPAGMPAFARGEAQAALVRRWLEVFGPAPVSDIEWWTGWTKAAVRAALTALPAGALVEVALEGGPGVMLAGSLEDGPVGSGAGVGAIGGSAVPAVTLLPALDPTPMGYKARDWLFGVPQEGHYDTNGNLGPTLWSDGQIVGTWAVAPSGEVRVRVTADLGSELVAGAEAAGAALQERLGGATWSPAFRTPLETALRQ